MSQLPKFRVAICGAGIGGLALAVTVGKFGDLPVDLYEAGSEVSTVGAGIAVGKRTWEIVQKLGLDAELAKKTISPPEEKDGPGPVYRRSDQPEDGYSFFHQILSYGAITLHRADMVDILKQNILQSCMFHFSKKLVKYTQGENGVITLHFADGMTAETDVLIGADGVRSAVRVSVFESIAKEEAGGASPVDNEKYRRYAQPTWSGVLAYRFLIPTQKLQAVNPAHRSIFEPTAYCGKSKHIISYPISQGRLINVVAFYTVENGEGTTFPGKWVTDTSAEEVRDCYQGWEPLVGELLSCVEKPSKWAIHVLESLPHYVSGGVALIGDAAHAMTTHFGAGAGQAIEDAYTLGRILTHNLTQSGNLPAALRVYEEIQLFFANDIARNSRIAGLMYEFNAPGLYDGRDRSREKEELNNIGRAIERQWAWHSHGGAADDDWVRAEGRLEEAIRMERDVEP